MNQTLIYGSDLEGLKIEYITDVNGDYVGINNVKLVCFGKVQPIYDIVEPMLVELQNKVMSHISTQRKYRRLEKDFKEILKDTVIIENEPLYIECLREFESRTRNCDAMHDLNSGLNSF